MVRFRTLLLATLAVIPLGIAPAAANPLGAQVVGGSATVQGQGTASVTVTQTTNSAIVNWNTFNIGAGDNTNIVMPGSTSVQLDRVIGGLGPSAILGSLTSNGRVFLVNPDGILFGAASTVNTSGFVATTHDIANADFMAGKYNFSIPGNPSASIVNLGTITASNTGFAALVAPGVRNSGTITANLGTVTLASGNGFTLDFYGDKLITLNVNDSIGATVKDVATGQTLNALVQNDGKLKADGGRVELTAVAARQVVDSVINNTGVIEADTVGTKNGMIVLGAATAASLPAGAPAQTVKVSGKLSAAGKTPGAKGGTIQVTGRNIVLNGAVIDASGAAGGGTVLIGGDTGGGTLNPAFASNSAAQLQPYAVATASTVTVDAATTIDASARDSGNGGKVVVWSDQATAFYGSVMARGGASAGTGGFVETSGHTLDFAGARVDTSASNGKSGSWLLDPYDLTINSTAASTISTSLATTDVFIETTASGATGPGTTNPSGNGDIFVDAGISWNSSHNLTLSAYRNIELYYGVVIANGGSGNVVLRADNTGTDVGTLFFNPSSKVDLSAGTGSISLYYNPSNYSSPANYQSFGHVVPGSGGSTEYMLVNNLNDLQNISTNATTLGGTYALGKDIDATGFVSAGPGTSLTGLLDGNGGVGADHTISNLSLASGSSPVGLFGFIGTTGTVRNLKMANVNLTATGDLLFMGPLAGENDGTIENVQVVSGTINGGTHVNIGAGGLVGQNRGSITDSSSAVNITLGNAGTQFNIAGGLVGSNIGLIQSSSATGTIITGTNSVAGGLAGQNGLDGDGGGIGVISSSFATGAVSGGEYVGGLVGLTGTGANSVIAGSHASGNVTLNFSGSGNGAAGGLVAQNGGSIDQSYYDTGTVSGSGVGNANPMLSQFVNVGGLVGVNFNGGTITDSHATATITGSVGSYGGLVGNNFGAITGTTAGSVYANATLNIGGAHTSAGALVGANSNAATIVNANATGSVSVLDSTVLSKVGGLVGQNDGSVDHSTANVTVHGGLGSAGGLVGQNDSVISNSSASGNVVGGSTGNSLGGLAGNNSSGGQISNSSASGSVSGGVSASSGGLVGRNEGTITTSTSTSNVSGSGVSMTTAFLGGLVGDNVISAQITNSSASGTITAGSYADAGGLAGQNSGTISGSSATGIVNPGSSADGFANAGGLVGHNSGSISNSFATVSLSGGALTGLVLGGLVGTNDQSGTITGSHADGSVTVGNGISCDTNCNGFNFAGGLAGRNDGSIMSSYATGDVSGGAFSFVGGLVGQLGNGGFLPAAVIGTSYASGNVTIIGLGSAGGGLVGQVSQGSSVTDSQAFGTVTATANATDLQALVQAGGLVGISAGTITSTTTPLAASNCVAGASFSCASGNVSVGTLGNAGGLVGLNDGTIAKSFATGAVTGAPGLPGFGDDDNRPGLGGLAGRNDGTITDSFAAGNVGAPGVAYLEAGGLVAQNNGTILRSFATGNVRTGDSGDAGGLVATNGPCDNPSNCVAIGDGQNNAMLIQDSHAYGAVSVGTQSFAGGLVGLNTSHGTIATSFATGNVTGGSSNFMGGLVGVSGGQITNSYATGAVSGGDNSILGGLAGVSDGAITSGSASGAVSGGSNSILGGFAGFTDLGTITNSTTAATSIVTGTGSNSWVGGFVGSNGGTISQSHALGAVNSPGLSDSLVGGFAGINFGVITDSTTAATATVLASGTNNYVGGFVGANFGFIDPSTSAGTVTGGASNFVGGFAGTNASFINIPPGLIPGSTFPVGTISSDSVASGAAGGGAGSTVNPQIGTIGPTALPDIPSVLLGCGSPLCTIIQAGLTLAPPPPTSPETPVDPLPPPVTQIVPPITDVVTTPPVVLASLVLPTSPAGAVSTTGPVATGPVPGKPSFIPPPLPSRPTAGPNGETSSSIPPLGETRFFQNQVLMQLELNTPDSELNLIAQRLGLRIVTNETLTSLGRRVIRLELPAGLPVREAIRRLEANSLVAVAAPVYRFRLVQGAAAAVSRGDPAQYVMGKLHLPQAHAIASGKGITIALIDSAVDKRHTELQGTISDELDTLGVKEGLPSHGTEMAGAIVSRDRLLGVAPGAKIMTVRAFGEANNSAEGTSLSIVKGIDWAVSRGARVINMSFAGPRDPSLERALKMAHDKGVVLIAAAGNAGPKSPPLYPGADPHVIAVTATDARDQQFRGANQGTQLSIAAPGVDILAPAPAETYRMSTGTSIATAHVSGVVALMLERDPTMKPDDVRKILESTATDLGAKGKDRLYGWGLVDPPRALEAVAARLKSSDAAPKGR